jgi:hypothetical protein
MSITEKLNNTEKDTLQLVLEEYAQEQAGNTKAVNDLITVVNGLTGKIKEFEEKIEKPKTVKVSTDILPIMDIVSKGITDIKLAVAAQPKSIVKKFQILLFPEQDRKLFYRVVFGRWLVLLVIMLFITNLYKWGVHWNDNQKEVQHEQLENDRINKAWFYLYKNEGKAVRRLMDSAYSKNGIPSR